jgi:hypothetical protein
MTPTPNVLSLAGREWHAVDGASNGEIESLLAALPFEPPPEYIALLRLSNGGEGELALPPLWFQLFDVAFAIRLWQDRHHRSEYPNLFFFGSNGGLESIAFDMSNNQPWPIVMVDCVAGVESAENIASNVGRFIAAVGMRSEGAA